MRKKLLVIIAYAVVIAAAVTAYLVPTGRVYVRPAAAATESSEEGTTALAADKAFTSASGKTTASASSAAKKKEDKNPAAEKPEESGTEKSLKPTPPQPVSMKSADGRYEVLQYTDQKEQFAAHDSNIRSGPASSYDLSGSLKKGEKVTVSGEVKELDGRKISPVWCEITLPDGTKGFVRSDLLTEQQPEKSH